MASIAPFRPLPLGHREFTLTIVLATDRACDEIATDAVLAMLTADASIRQAKAETTEGLTTLRVRYGSTNDFTAHTAAAGAVQMASRAGDLNGVTVMAGARFVVAAHTSLA